MFLPELLKFCLRHSDGAQDPDRSARSEEEIQVLRKVINEYMAQAKNVNEIVKEAYSVLEDSRNETEVLKALETILACVEEDPEVSRNMANFSIAGTLIHVLLCNNPDHVLLMLKILSTSVQNNPALQSEMFKHNHCLYVLLGILDAACKRDFLSVNNVETSVEEETKNDSVNSLQCKKDVLNLSQIVFPKKCENIISSQNQLSTEPKERHSLSNEVQDSESNLVNNLQLGIPLSIPDSVGSLVPSVMIKTNEEADALAEGSMGAISALIRSHNDFEKMFVEGEGIKHITKILEDSASSEKLQLKAMVLLKWLLNCGSITLPQLRHHKIVEAVTTMMSHHYLKSLGIEFVEIVADFLVEVLEKFRFSLIPSNGATSILLYTERRLSILKAAVYTEEVEQEKKQLLHAKSMILLV